MPTNFFYGTLFTKKSGNISCLDFTLVHGWSLPDMEAYLADSNPIARFILYNSVMEYIPSNLVIMDPSVDLNTSKLKRAFLLSIINGQ